VACGSDKDAMAGMSAMVEAIHNAGGQTQFAQIGNNREECSGQFHGSGQTYEWLLKQKRRTEKERQERDQQMAAAQKEALAKLPRTPGHHRVEYSTWIGTNKITIPYLVYLPKGYDKTNGPWPTLLFMHGAGEADRNLGGMFVHGPGFEINKSEKFRDWYPLINIYPAYVENHPDRIKAVARLMNDAMARFRIDRERVYCTGLSLGGTATWLMALEAPEMFAGIAPISGREAAPDRAGSLLRHVFTWLVAGTNDGAFTEAARKMAGALTQAKAELQFSSVPGGDHGVWIRYYADARFYEQLLEHRRLSPEQRKAREQSGPPGLRPDPPAEPGHHRLAFTTTIADKPVAIPYGLYLPRGYDKSKDRLPALLYLHDPADRGTDLAWRLSMGFDPAMANNGYPFIGVCPQLPPDRKWEEPQMVQGVLAMLDDASRKARIDPDRVCVTGAREAGTGAWAMMLESPDRFAAIASFQTWSIPLVPDKLQPKHKYINGWMGAVGNENGVADTAKRVVDAIKKMRGNVELALAPNPQAAPAQPYYTDATLAQSLLKARRLTAADRALRAAQEAREELVTVPTVTGIHRKVFEAKADGKPFDLPYAISLPQGYAQTQERFALVMDLHDADARGADHGGLFRNGPVAVLQEQKELRERLRAIVVGPQCPPDRAWTQPQMMAHVGALLDHLSSKLRVDADRVYLTGLGMGGTATWQAALESPDRFAAIAPVQAAAVRLDQADRLRYVASWIAADFNDASAADMARRMAAALGNTSSEVKLDLPWEFNEDPRWKKFFAQQGLYDWLLAHRRLNEQERRTRDERQAKMTAPGAVPATPGHHKMKALTVINGKDVEVPYLVYLPQGYEKSSARWPTLVFLHGAGEGQPDLSGIFVHGPAAHIQGDQRLRDWYPLINISPIHGTSPEGARGAIAALDDAIRKLRIDPDRVYLTGFSLGGTGVWWTAFEGADRFAAVASICGRALNPDQVAPRLKYGATWIAVGTADGDFFVGSQQMQAALKKVGADVHLTLWPGQGHGIWGAYYGDRRFYEWFLPHRRLSAQQRALRDQGLFPTAVPSSDGSHVRQTETQLGGKPAKFTYGLYLPKGYAADAQKRWPVMVHLHHENDRGSDLATVFNWGTDTEPRRNENERFGFPMIGVAPQCPADRSWSDPEIIKAVCGLMDELGKSLRVDASRIYLAGSGSMGQAGAWAMAMAQPQRFAAVAPFCMEEVFKPEMAPRLRGASVSLTTLGRDEGAVGRVKRIMDLLKPHAALVALNLISEDPSRPAWQPYYTDPKLCQWLLGQRR
jgi:predicted peptidase